MFPFDGIVISISLQVEFTESLTMMSRLFAVLVLLVRLVLNRTHVPHDGDVAFIVHHSLRLVLVKFVFNLDIMIFTDASVAIRCSFIVPGDVLCLY